jgi:hypothetical protein
MIGALITEDWQMEFRGLLLGAGTNIDLVQIEGLLGFNQLTTSDRPRFRRNGLHLGFDFLGGRSVVLTLEVYGRGQELTDLMRQVQLAFQPTAPEAPLAFQFPGVACEGKSFVNVRTRRREGNINVDYHYGLAIVMIELAATDPRIYSCSTGQVTTRPLADSAGLTWPLTWPLSWGAAGEDGIVEVNNRGTFPAPAIIRIDGPVTDPTIEHANTGSVLKLNATMADGDYVLIDTDLRLVLLNGTSNRYSWLDSTSEWFELAPGSNGLVYRADASPDSLLTVTWRPAWL